MSKKLFQTPLEVIEEDDIKKLFQTPLEVKRGGRHLETIPNPTRSQ